MKRRRLFRAESGTSLVEFAILAPVIIFLLIGVIEIGRFAFFSILAANAARAGAQYGAQESRMQRSRTARISRIGPHPAAE
jgi:Flp pilus assembly protein TadG